VPKTSQLQIRVTPQEKRQLRARAAAAGLDVSTYVLTRALPRDSDAITQIVRRIPEAAELSYALAELHDALVSLTAAGFPAAVAHVDVGRLSAFEANYVTAMVEHSAVARGMTAPAWCRWRRHISRRRWRDSGCTCCARPPWRSSAATCLSTRWWARECRWRHRARSAKP
jgi:uncharacterized protein (DUF1778 family)